MHYTYILNFTRSLNYISDKKKFLISFVNCSKVLASWALFKAPARNLIYKLSSDKILFNASAKACIDLFFTNIPLTFCLMVNGMAELSNAITGNPYDKASSNTIPYPSNNEGNTKTFAERYKSSSS